MTKTVTKRTVPGRATNGPMSVGTLAEILGVSRQRVYTLVKQGKIRTVQMVGGSVVLPDEVERVLASATKVNVKGAERLRFDFSVI